MAEVNLLPAEYKLRRQSRRRRLLSVAAFFIIFSLLCGRVIGLFIQTQALRSDLAEMQKCMVRLGPELEKVEELQTKIREMKQGLHLLRNLEQTQHPYPALLREIEADAQDDIILEGLHFDREGRLIIRGRVEGLEDLAAFLSALNATPGLEAVDLNHITRGQTEGWLFDIRGQAGKEGEG